MNRLGRYIDEHGLWPLAFVVVMVLWGGLLNATVGLETLRRLLGWTIGPGA